MKTTTTTTTIIQATELANYELAPTVCGFGLCGYAPDEGGYVYATEGHGNSESYISMQEMLGMLEEDGMKIIESFEIVLNENGQIIYIHMDVWRR